MAFAKPSSLHVCVNLFGSVLCSYSIPPDHFKKQSLTPRLHRCPSVQGSDIEPGAVQFINHGKQTDYLSRASMQKNQD